MTEIQNKTQNIDQVLEEKLREAYSQIQEEKKQETEKVG